MGVFKKGKNNSNLDRKIARLDEDLKKTGVVRESNITSMSENDKTKDVQMITEHVKSDWRSGYKKEEISKEDILQEEINAVRNKKNSLRKVDGYIASINENYTQLKKDIFQELSQDFLHNIPSLEKKINRVLEIYDVVQEGLLNQPPETQTQDPLTPLDQQFVTAQDLDAHYKLFINRIQEQIATIGGGGEVRLKWLDDVVGIATNASAYDGQFLKYDHSIEKFVFETVSGVGTGSQGIQGTTGSQGIQGIQGPSGVGGGGTGYFEQTAAGIHTTSSVGIGTTADSAYSLLVEGDARITGILTVGPASVTIDGINNEVTIGTGVTIYGNTGIVSATSIYAAGSLLTGAQGTQGVQGITGSQGTQGIQGTVGSFGGATFDYTFDSGISTADPGAGRLKFNYVGLSTVTEMYIDDTDDNGTDIQSFMRTIDDSDSTIKGHFKVSNKINAEDFALFTISALTEETGYFTVNCAYVSGAATSFTNDEDVLITFARTGDKGDTGTQGTQGVQGVQGLTGSGTQGATGIQGTQGINGPQGRQGIQGIQGYGGTQGTQGRQGTTGAQGITGAGTQGAQGFQGTTGEQGVQGITGPDGTQGTQGTTGQQGTQGITGDTGAQGTSGSAVAQGYQGIQGIPGQGVQGTDGTAAFQGYQGIQGIQGESVQGVQGIQGDAASVQGYQGTQGIQGLTGAGAQGTQGIQGTDGPLGGPGAQGIQGIDGSQGNQGTQGVQGQEGLPGDQGIQGIVGSQGTTGTQGAGGTQGAEGAQGADGAQGITGDQGVQGITGEQGIQGIQGEGVQGIQGADGAAAAQGYQGIQGLPGDQGIQGLQGIAGEAAAQGIQGIQGSTGTQGTDGTQGANGAQGITGDQGIQGIQGTVGSQGTDGTQGTTGDQGIQGITGTGTQGIQGILGAQGTSGEAAAQGIQGIQGPAGVGGGGGGAGYWEQTAVGINTISNVGIATTNPLTPLQIEDVYGIKTGIGTFDAVVGVAADLDSFDTSSLNFQTAEYTINVGFGTYIQSQKVLVMQNGTTAYSQEYAVMYNPDLVVSIGATMTGTTCKLQATPETGITGLTTYRFVRTTLL